MAGLRIAGSRTACGCCTSTFTCGGCAVPTADLTLSWTNTGTCGNGSCTLTWDSTSNTWVSANNAICPEANFFGFPHDGLTATVSCFAGEFFLTFTELAPVPQTWCSLNAPGNNQPGGATITTTFTCSPFYCNWDFTGCTASDPNIHNCCAGNFSLTGLGFTSFTLTS